MMRPDAQFEKPIYPNNVDVPKFLEALTVLAELDVKVAKFPTWPIIPMSH